MDELMTAPSLKNLCEIHPDTDHERVVSWSDPDSVYRGIIAIHNTTLGPALGGTRFWNYRSNDEALNDALRLSRGMSYKNAMAGLPFGGGKSVIIGDNRTSNREQLFRAHGRFVETFQGRYITAEDVGTTPDDMEYIRRETAHVGGLPGHSGDPSPVTARGVFRAIQAAAKHRWGLDDLAERTVAIQGCGKTGYYLARELKQAGAKLVVADVDSAKVARVVEEFDAGFVSSAEIFSVRADVFAPCALGGIINDQTIPELQVEIVAGAANNQLLEERHGDVLHERGILFAPDYVCNAGGVMSGCRELLGWDSEKTFSAVDGIYDKVLTVLNLARQNGVPPAQMADSLAQKILYPE
jgi:leucine dehydrogenase